MIDYTKDISTCLQIVILLGICLLTFSTTMRALWIFLSLISFAVLTSVYVNSDYYAAVLLILYAGAITVLFLSVVIFINCLFTQTSLWTQKILEWKSCTTMVVMFLVVLKIVDRLHSILDKISKVFYLKTPKAWDMNYHILKSFFPDSLLLHCAQFAVHPMAPVLIGLALLIALFGAIFFVLKKSRF